MAQPALDNFRRRGLAVDAADSAVTSAGDAIQILDGKAGTEFDKVERKIDRAFLGNYPFIVKNKRAYIEGMIEFVVPSVPGHSTNGVASVAPVLLPCGMAQTLSSSGRTTTFTPVSSGFAAADAKWWHSGTYLQIFDARGNLSGAKMEVGERFMGNLRLQGSYTEIDEASLPTDFDYSDFTVPQVASDLNSTLEVSSLGAAAISSLNLWGKSLSFDLGNDVQRVEYTEHSETRIKDRLPTFTCRIARPAKADFDVHAIRDSGELITLTMRTFDNPDQATGKYSELHVRGQIEQINQVDIDGDFGYEISGPLVPSDSGNDEFRIRFGDATLALSGTPAGATNGVAYAGFTPTVAGEYIGTLAYTISSGTLPTGLSINASTGAITGTPSATGTSNFTIRAEDDASPTPQVATLATSIVVS